jgi:hypothetical protein
LNFSSLRMSGCRTLWRPCPVSQTWNCPGCTRHPRTDSGRRHELSHLSIARSPDQITCHSSAYVIKILASSWLVRPRVRAPTQTRGPTENDLIGV